VADPCKGIIGVAKDNGHIVDIAFDILSLEALFLIPRFDF
jgi:hypothetical protein